MSLGNIKLITPVYEGHIVSMDPSYIRSLSIPVLCPKCLKPAERPQVIRLQSDFWQGGQKYARTIQFAVAAHAHCASGFRSRDIGGSFKASLPSQNRLSFVIENPLYATIFIAMNFAIFRDGRGRPLQGLYDQEMSDQANRRIARAAANDILCPRCMNIMKRTDANSLPFECPSCHFNLDQDRRSEGAERSPPTSIDQELPVPSISLGSSQGMVIKCPHCKIAMMSEGELTLCGRCGSDLEME
jgi:hypothetical protein